MKEQDAQLVVTAAMKPIYAFALRRCRTPQDAEDLTQEILLRSLRALRRHDSVDDPEKFIWTVAHNALRNYYRDRARTVIGIPLEEVEPYLAEPDTETAEKEETVLRLQSEIAYLSRLQRAIVIAYYFEHRPQADIAKELGIPLGTVKWHLFEAKKELRKGITTMRDTSELRFRPIRFHSYGINGSCGSRDIDEFFRSTLSQNICYAVRQTPKTVAEIADDLGVSPVYIEGEVDFLCEHGLLLREKDRYLIHFVLSEMTEEILILQDTMYKKAAALVAEELHDTLCASGILQDPDIYCGATDGPLTLTGVGERDENFLLWSLIPFILARSGEGQMDSRISFEEVATRRKDGGHNIIHATVVPEHMTLPEDYVSMENWCGPMWNWYDGAGSRILWRVDSPWADHSTLPVNPDYDGHARRILSLYTREQDELLSRDEYAYLAERGLIKTCGDYDGHFKTSWQIVQFATRDVQDRLLAVGAEIKARHHGALEALKKPYAEAVLATVPKHMRRAREYELQFVFHSDGWFLLHCLTHLVRCGKLREVSGDKKKALMTVIGFA